MIRRNIFYEYGIKLNHMLILLASMQLLSMIISYYSAVIYSLFVINIPFKFFIFAILLTVCHIKFYSSAMIDEQDFSKLGKLHIAYCMFFGFQNSNFFSKYSSKENIFEFCVIFFTLSIILSNLISLNNPRKQALINKNIDRNFNTRYLIIFFAVSGLTHFLIFRIIALILGILRVAYTIASIRECTKKTIKSLDFAIYVLIMSLFNTNVILLTCLKILHMF